MQGNIATEQETYKFSDSRSSIYLTCPSMFYWKYIRNLVGTGKNVDLKYGEIIHSMFQTFYSVWNETGSESKAFEAAKSLLIEQYCDNQIEHTNKTIEAGLKFLRDVINFGLHRIGEVTPERKIEVSLIEVGGLQVKYTGKIDLTVQTPKATHIYDFKTVSRFSSSYYIKMEMARQFTGYCWLSKTTQLGLIPLHCIQKPKAYAPYFLDYPTEFIAIWLEEIKSICHTILRKIRSLEQDNLTGLERANQIFPKSCSLCTDTTKAWGCDYKELCQQGKFEDVIVDDMLFKEREEQG